MPLDGYAQVRHSCRDVHWSSTGSGVRLGHKPGLSQQGMKLRSPFPYSPNWHQWPHKVYMVSEAALNHKAWNYFLLKIQTISFWLFKLHTPWKLSAIWGLEQRIKMLGWAKSKNIVGGLSNAGPNDQSHPHGAETGMYRKCDRRIMHFLLHPLL